MAKKKAVDTGIVDCTEQKRLNEAREAGIPWKKWGPYLSERQWGTVREDYSADGNAWDYFTHDQSRSRAYRWGEDGLGGFSDDKQRLCFALALWNERDPILKERAFGLTNSEGNHGEDVKEYYFYVDSTPTHSYMKYLYKYPQREFPYRDLVETNRRRTKEELEYELLDTGIFDDDRYFDVFLEYAKEGPEDILIRCRSTTAGRRRPGCTSSRRCGSGTPGRGETRERSRSCARRAGRSSASHPELGEYTLSCGGSPELLFTENETNAERLWGQPNPTPYVKDAFHRYVISGEQDAVNPGEDRDEGRGALRPRGAGGRRASSSSSAWPRGRRAGRSARRSRRRSGSGCSTPTSSTTGSRPARSARTSAGSTARRSRGCSGRSSTTTSTSTGG